MYEIIVGNIGLVHRGDSKSDARAVYEEYKLQSSNGQGRAGCEPVTLLCDGDVIEEYLPPEG